MDTKTERHRVSGTPSRLRLTRSQGRTQTHISQCAMLVHLQVRLEPKRHLVRFESKLVQPTPNTRETGTSGGTWTSRSQGETQNHVSTWQQQLAAHLQMGFKPRRHLEELEPTSVSPPMVDRSKICLPWHVRSLLHPVSLPWAPAKVQFILGLHLPQWSSGVCLGDQEALLMTESQLFNCGLVPNVGIWNRRKRLYNWGKAKQNTLICLPIAPNWLAMVISHRI